MNDALVDVPEFPPGAKGILWENWPLDKVCRSSTSWEEKVPNAFIVPTCFGIMVLVTLMCD